MANTRIPIFNADAQTAYIDFETESTNGDGRQVVVIGSPSVNAAVAEVASLDPGPTSNAYGQVVRLAGSAQVQIAGSSGTIGVHLQSTGGTIGVRVGQIDGTTSVYLAQTAGTIWVKLVPETGLPAGLNAIGKLAANSGVDIGDVTINNATGAAAVNIQDGGNALTVDGTLTGITNSIAVHVLSTNGTMAVNVGKVDGTVAIYLHSTGGTLGVRVGQIDGSAAVHLVGTGGSLAVKIDPSYNVVNVSSTILLPSTVSGSTSGISASGVTLIAPEANHNIKVFAYSIQSTGAVSQAIIFGNGSGAGQTEFWRPLVTEGGVTGVQGANLAISPPGYIFATGVNTTLVLFGNDGGLVHYSIGYFKESA